MTASSSLFRHVADTQATWLSVRSFGELRRLMYGFNHAALVSLACAGNVKSSAMINGGSDNRKAKRYIDTALEAEDFDGAVALVMVHGDNHIEVAPLSQVEKCVSGQGSGDVPTKVIASGDCGFDLRSFFASSKKAVLARVRIDGADTYAGIGDTAAEECSMGARDGALDKPRLDLFNGIQQTDMGGDVNHAQTR